MEGAAWKVEFEQLVAAYLKQLKEQYAERIESATNKEYAFEYFRKILLEHNREIPFNTVYFDRLHTTFVHYRNMDKANAQVLTLQQLPFILQHSQEAYEKAMIMLLSDGDLADLPSHYHYLMSEKGCMLTDIVDQEKQTAAIDSDEAIKMLAMHEALQQFFSTELSSADVEETPNDAHPFSRAHQALIGLYLFKAAGFVMRGNVSISDCAILLHRIAREPYNHLHNSEIYNRLSKPVTYGYSSPKAAIKDLNHIRLFFQKDGFEKVIGFIDEDIAKLQTSISAR